MLSRNLLELWRNMREQPIVHGRRDYLRQVKKTSSPYLVSPGTFVAAGPQSRARGGRSRRNRGHDNRHDSNRRRQRATPATHRATAQERAQAGLTRRAGSGVFPSPEAHPDKAVRKARIAATRRLIVAHYRNARKQHWKFHAMEMRELFHQLIRDDALAPASTPPLAERTSSNKKWAVGVLNKHRPTSRRWATGVLRPRPHTEGELAQAGRLPT